MFRDWFHSDDFMKEDEETPERKIIQSPKNTITSNAIVCIFLPGEVSQMISDAEPRLHFWNSISDESNSPSELARICQDQFSKTFLKTRFHCKSNPCDIWVDQFLEKASVRPKNHRIMIYYYNYFEPVIDNSKISFLKSDMQNKTEMNVKDLIMSAGNPSAFVFDCSNSGALLNQFIDNGRDKDVYAFFSCSEGEKNPTPFRMPSDLFTSILTSAPRIAVILHSKRYFHFKDSTLRPIDIFNDISSDTYSDIDFIDHISSSINQIMKKIVEAMAFELMDNETFTKLFRVDLTIAQLVVNFIFACRILETYGVHPVSYPQLPSFTSHHMWDTFDLYLDSELIRIQQNQQLPQVMQNYSMQSVLTTFETMVGIIRDYKHPFIEEISFMRLILTHFDPEIRSRATLILAKYVDLSYEAIDIALHFQVVSPLIKILSTKATPEAAFCILKISEYAGGLLQVISEKIDNIYLHLLSIFHTSPVPIALTTKLVKSSEKAAKMFLATNWVEVCTRCMDSKQMDIRVWTFLLISVLLDILPNEVFDKLSNSLLISLNTCNAEASYALLDCVPALSRRNKTKEVQKILNTLSKHLSPNVRKRAASIAFICKESVDYESFKLNYDHDIDESVVEFTKSPKTETKSVDRFLKMTKDHVFNVFEYNKFSPIDSDYEIPPFTQANINNDITTAIASISNNEVAFGDSNGIGRIYRSQEECIETQLFDPGTTISAVDVLANSDDPLFVAIQKGGECRVTTTDGIMRTRFIVDEVRSHDSWKLSLQQKNGSMIAFTNDGIAPFIVDLASEKKLGNVGVKGAIAAGFSNTYPNRIGICTSTNLCLHDTRAEHVALTCSFNSRLIGMKIDSGVIVATEDGRIHAIDLRWLHPKVINKSEIENPIMFDAGDDIFAIASQNSVEIFSPNGSQKLINVPDNTIRSFACAKTGNNVFLQESTNLIIKNSI